MFTLSYVPLFKQQKLFVRYSYLHTTFLQATCTLALYSSYTIIRYSAHNLYCKHYGYSLDFLNGDLQILNLSSHMAVATSVLSCLFICARLQSLERSQSRSFMISPSRELYSDSLCMCILILVHLLFLLVVYLVIVRCIC